MIVRRDIEIRNSVIVGLYQHGIPRKKIAFDIGMSYEAVKKVLQSDQREHPIRAIGFRPERRKHVR